MRKVASHQLPSHRESSRTHLSIELLHAYESMFKCFLYELRYTSTALDSLLQLTQSIHKHYFLFQKNPLRTSPPKNTNFYLNSSKAIHLHDYLRNSN